MAMLGDLLAAARRSSAGFQAWLTTADAALMERVEVEAARSDESPTSYVRTAIWEFDRFATEEDWATLTSQLKASDDPGMTCLLGMVRWRLATAAKNIASPRAEAADG